MQMKSNSGGFPALPEREWNPFFKFQIQGLECKYKTMNLIIYR